MLRRRKRNPPESEPAPRGDDEAAARTDALLRRLPEREWTVLSGVDARHGVDHVLVGRRGVFAISSRKPAGARMRDGVLWLRRERDRDHDARADRPGVAINRHVLDGARALQRDVRTRTGRGPAVHAVVVLWCEFPQGVAESSRIAFVRGRDLPSWLAERPPELDDLGRGEIAQALRAREEDGARRARLDRLSGVRARARRRPGG